MRSAPKPNARCTGVTAVSGDKFVLLKAENIHHGISEIVVAQTVYEDVPAVTVETLFRI
jgi:hypothetical protein